MTDEPNASAIAAMNEQYEDECAAALRRGHPDSAAIILATFHEHHLLTRIGAAIDAAAPTVRCGCANCVGEAVAALAGKLLGHLLGQSAEPEAFLTRAVKSLETALQAEMDAEPAESLH